MKGYATTEIDSNQIRVYLCQYRIPLSHNVRMALTMNT